MPTMGIPDNGKPNPYREVGMSAGNKPKSNAEIINQATGQVEKSKFKEGPHNKMGKDEFLRLLTFQLTNQDPMNPMDQNKFAAELAQFSQLEQLTNMNQSIGKLNNNAPAEKKYLAASFLGKKVMTSGTSIDFRGQGTTAPVSFFLKDKAQGATIKIFDPKGNLIAQLEKENLSAGNQTVDWNGIRLDGQYEAKGPFSFQVTAWDDKYEPVRVETKTSGVVSAAFFENDEMVLTVNGRKVYLRDVERFEVPEEINSNSPKLNNGDTVTNNEAIKSYKNTQGYE